MAECDYCSESFDGEEALLEHMRDEHEGELGRIDQRRVADLEGEETEVPTGPIARAASASTTRPDSARSIAAPRPTTSGSRTVPPQAPNSPSRTPVSANVAAGVATRRSQASASSTPPPRAGPSTPATTTGSLSAMARATRWP